MATAEEPRTFIRPDGKEKVTGTGRYTADLVLAGQLMAKFRYADHTHARITRIDATKARALPGVLAVVTHEDVPDVLYGGMVKDRRLFARDTVRFEGDIVAGVAATTAEIAEQAAALIEVEYEPLPVVTDFEAALADDATLVHPDWEAYEGEESLGRNRNTLGYSTIVKGDVDAALAGADVVVKGRYVTDPVQGVPIEPRAVVAQWQGDRVTVWTSTQVPYAARGGVAHTLQIPESHVRVVVPLLGGGFGAKCDFHFEGHVAALARAARRPVKLVFSRREEFFAVGHRREGMVIELETGASADGTLVARKARLVLDKGAYCGEGGFFAQMAAMHALGPYEIENVHVESSLVYSNNQPSSSIRAPTAPQVCWALEQHMDELAEALGLDPVDLRRRTLIENGSVTATGQVLERIAMKETLEQAVELIGYGQELPDDEAIGVSVRLVAVLRRVERRLREAEPGRHRHDRHRRPGERHGRGDGDADLRRRAARHEARGLLDALPGHRRGALGHGLLRLADDVQQRPRRDRGRRRRARPAARRGRRAARGLARRSRAGRRIRPRQGLARQVGDDRRPRRQAARSTARAQASCRTAPEAPAEGCVGRLGLESFHAPQLIAHAARVKVDRDDRRRARAPGRGRARLRHDPQQDRRRRAGLRRRRDGDRPGALRRHSARRRRAAPQRAPDSTTSS